MEAPEGSFAYFRDTVGLPSVGVIPGRTLNSSHCSKGKCIAIWGKRAPHGGYRVRECRNEAISTLVDDLWPKVYQLPTITNNQITQAFAQGILAHHKRIRVNWAQFAAHVWSRRKNHSNVGLQHGEDTTTIDIDGGIGGEEHDAYQEGEASKNGGIRSEEDVPEIEVHPHVHAGIGGKVHQPINEAPPNVHGGLLAVGVDGGVKIEGQHASNGVTSRRNGRNVQLHHQGGNYEEAGEENVIFEGAECSTRHEAHGKRATHAKETQSVLKLQQQAQVRSYADAKLVALRKTELEFAETEKTKQELAAHIQESKRRVYELQLQCNTELGMSDNLKSEMIRLGNCIRDNRKEMDEAEHQLVGIRTELIGTRCHSYAIDQYRDAMGRRDRFRAELDAVENDNSKHLDLFHSFSQELGSCQTKLNDLLAQYHDLDCKLGKINSTLFACRSFHKFLEGKMSMVGQGVDIVAYPAPLMHNVICPREPKHILLKSCPVCGGWFKVFEVVVAPCQCTYHAWCVASHLKSSTKCADGLCSKEFDSDWCVSMGFGAIGNIQGMEGNVVAQQQETDNQQVDS